jgi:hypothetical protein
VVDVKRINPVVALMLVWVMLAFSFFALVISLESGDPVRIALGAGGFVIFLGLSLAATGLIRRPKSD